MDNMITGFIGSAIFLAFVGGLAESIAAAPFVIIVFCVAALMVTDYVQSVKEGLRAKKTTATKPKSD